MMETLKASVFINRSPEFVFNFLKKIEPRLRLSPAYRILNFKKITDSEISKGTRFHIVLMGEHGKREYISENL